MTRQKIRDFECPNCNQTLHASATYCGCGWKKRAPDKTKTYALGYQQCEYQSGGAQCRYPGSISNDTKGIGPWYCTAHSKLLIDAGHPSVGAQIVESSRNYRQAQNWNVVDVAARARLHAPKFNRHTWKPHAQPARVAQREPGQDDEFLDTASQA